jgi:hypothetical protein
MSMLSVDEGESSALEGRLLCTLSMTLGKVHPLRWELGKCRDAGIVLASNGSIEALEVHVGAAQRTAIKKIFYGKSDKRILEFVERKACCPLG